MSKNEKHYFDLTDNVEKIIHILYAGYVCGYYEKNIKECAEFFGTDTTNKALNEFEEKYIKTITVLE